LAGGNVGEKWHAFLIPVDIVCNTIRGYGFAVFWYPNHKTFELFDEEFPSEIKRIFHRNDVPSVDKQVWKKVLRACRKITIFISSGLIFRR
jgi:hypothetical protein